MCIIYKVVTSPVHHKYKGKTQKAFATILENYTYGRFQINDWQIERLKIACKPEEKLFSLHKHSPKLPLVCHSNSNSIGKNSYGATPMAHFSNEAIVKFCRKLQIFTFIIILLLTPFLPFMALVFCPTYGAARFYHDYSLFT